MRRRVWLNAGMHALPCGPPYDVQGKLYIVLCFGQRNGVVDHKSTNCKLLKWLTNYNFKQKLGPRRTIITFENKSWETWWSVKTYRDTVNVFVFEVWKGTRWWWHFSTEWDNRDLLTQHLSALPSPIQTYKPPSTHCEWAAYHSTHSLLFFFPTTLIYSHNRSPVLFLRGECKHTNRCRGH